MLDILSCPSPFSLSSSSDEANPLETGILPIEELVDLRCLYYDKRSSTNLPIPILLTMYKQQLSVCSVGSHQTLATPKIKHVFILSSYVAFFHNYVIQYKLSFLCDHQRKFHNKNTFYNISFCFSVNLVLIVERVGAGERFRDSAPFSVLCTNPHYS